MTRRRCFPVLGASLLASCKTEREPHAPLDLLSPEWLPHWVKMSVPGSGEVRAEGHQLHLGEGSPMTCARFSAWQNAGLPVVDYAVEMEARRVKGQDFFAALTFPVLDAEKCISFINGGWGGATTGLSNLDSQTAAENLTASEQRYVSGQWHHFRIVVRTNEIAVWMDQRIIIRTALAGHLWDVRPGEIESCKPFGLASYNTSGEVRRLDVSRLPPE